MMTSSESPSWLDRDKIDEVLFCEELRAEHPMLCIHEVFFLFHKAHRVYLISAQGKLHKARYKDDGDVFILLAQHDCGVHAVQMRHIYVEQCEK